MARELPIHHRLVAQMARATVKTFVEGVVELVTNSDDSYRRLDDAGQEADGRIVIEVDRAKGGTCKRLLVRDFAEGMTQNELAESIVFGGETSGFQGGSKVRGYFGRGLKETILAMGTGNITSMKNGLKVNTSLWLDSNQAKYDEESLDSPAKTTTKNGTCIEVQVTNEKMKIPVLATLQDQLQNHYALRDIFSGDLREVALIYRDLARNRRQSVMLKFKPPAGKEVLSESAQVQGHRDKVYLTLWESDRPLTTPKNTPWGLGGVLIKTETATLDNRLFRFETEPAAQYFFGQVIVPGLEERLRQGQAEVLNQNRGGLDWTHDYCKALCKTVESMIEPVIARKKKDLAEPARRAIQESTRRLLKDLCNELNDIAEKELEFTADTSVERSERIEGLLLKPDVAYIPAGGHRTFTVYAPPELVADHGKEVRVSSNRTAIVPESSSVVLKPHPREPKTCWLCYFKVEGRKEGVEGRLVAELGDQTAMCDVKVREPSSAQKRTPTGKKSRFIRGIEPDPMRDPPQRAANDQGMIKIFVKFPSVAEYIDDAFENLKNPEAKMLMAEMIGETLCRTIAIRGIESGTFLAPEGGEIDAFNDTVNKLQKKYLHRIQRIMFAWEFSPDGSENSNS